MSAWLQGKGGQRRKDPQGPQKDLIKPESFKGAIRRIHAKERRIFLHLKAGQATPVKLQAPHQKISTVGKGKAKEKPKETRNIFIKVFNS